MEGVIRHCQRRCAWLGQGVFDIESGFSCSALLKVYLCHSPSRYLRCHFRNVLFLYRKNAPVVWEHAHGNALIFMLTLF
jgi:hypothetical protein